MHNLRNIKNYTMDFNQVSTKRTGVLRASFQYQARRYTVLETGYSQISGCILNECTLDTSYSHMKWTVFDPLFSPVLILGSSLLPKWKHTPCVTF